MFPVGKSEGCQKCQLYHTANLGCLHTSDVQCTLYLFIMLQTKQLECNTSPVFHYVRSEIVMNES